ncbi:MAG: hypothetical protein KGI49_01110 [Patescibacteria group bacterium]|nr:hypothetical protein [Patescibacteria group bacterium]
MNKKLIISAVLAVAVILAAVTFTAYITNKPGPANNGSASLAYPASITLLAPSGGNVDVGSIQHVKWISDNDAAGTVSVSVIRKVSDDPAVYEPVRTIAASKSDNGNAVWVPAKTDAGSDTFIQVGCAVSDQACTAGVSGSGLAVLDTGVNSNAASAYQAIESMYNR